MPVYRLPSSVRCLTSLPSGFQAYIYNTQRQILPESVKAPAQMMQGTRSRQEKRPETTFSEKGKWRYAKAYRPKEESMMDKVIENNQVTVMGKIVSGFLFSHEIYGEGFYMMDVEVERLSDSTDIIPVMVSDRLIDVTQNYTGVNVCIGGQFRSYNRHEEKKNKLVLSVFAREIDFIEEMEENAKTNQIFLDGFICKEPIYRKTPLGREIADLLLAVNRPYGKSDYIPCICWGRNARFASTFQVGDRCMIWGRIQSREYMKKITEEELEKRIAYEVSVSKLETGE